MNIFDQLNEELLTLKFGNDNYSGDQNATNYKQIALLYSKIENSIAVLSDIKLDKSHIYYGKIANELGLNMSNDLNEIESIWEDAILEKIHPEDLLMKHTLELQFFHFLKNISADRRLDYHIVSKMRMLDKKGEYVSIQHRMFYLCFTNESPLFALCLYNHLYEPPSLSKYEGMIVDSSTGSIIRADVIESPILSDREIEVLSLIRKGNSSLRIAEKLSISKHTVDRHRQNILEKLRVTNSIEACRVAELMKLF